MTRDSFHQAPPPENRLGRPPAFVLWIAGAMLMLGLLGGCIWIYQAQKQRARTLVAAQLDSIAKMKAQEIADWHAERFKDAAVIAGRYNFIDDMGAWLTDPASPRAKRAEALLRALDRYGYDDVVLVDPQGRPRQSLSGKLEPLDPEDEEAFAAARKERKAEMTDLHRRPSGFAHLDVVVPLSQPQPSAPLVGALLLKIDPRRFLYPMIQSWPVPSATAESLLVRASGDGALMLNELRHQKGTGLALRIPGGQNDVIAVQAVHGRRGVVDGHDYRGVLVLGSIQAIPETPWLLVAKIDHAEAFAGWRRLSWALLGLFATLFSLTVGLMYIGWQHNERARYRSVIAAQAAQRRADQRYVTTLFSIGDGVIATDGEARVQLLNPTAEELTGWTSEQAKGRRIEEIFHIVNEDTRGAVKSPVDRVLREGKVVGLANHTVLISRDGQERPIADSGAPIRLESGAIDGVVLVFRDQTKERRTEMLLREREELFRRLFTEAPVVAMLHDPADGSIVDANRAAVRFYGWPVEKLRTMRMADIRAEGAVEAPVVCHRLSNGDVREVECFPGAVQVGNRERVLTIVQDVTERNRARRALEESERRFRAIYDHMPVGVAQVSLDFHIQHANATYCRLLCIDEQNLIGKHLREITHPDCAEENLRQQARLVRGEIESYSLEKRFVCRDGRELFGLIGANLVRDERGQPAYTLGTLLDITDRKRAEAEQTRLRDQLAQAQRLDSIGRLAGGVAHDFNNMLGVILGTAELALERTDESSELREQLTQIRLAAERSARLTQQLLAFARRQTIAPRVVDLNATVAETLKMLVRLVGENVELTFLPGGELWPVKIDPGQIDQLLTNLVVNARDAISGTGKVRIEIANAVLDGAYCAVRPGLASGDFVRLTVSDTGCGMSPETAAHAFEPFFSTKGAGRGTGLGLATVYGIAQQNGGSVSLYSEPGRGTTIHVYLPRHAQGPMTEASGAREAPARAHGEVVLLVEDEALLLDLSKRMLERLGYDVLAASTPAEAIHVAEARTGALDLLVTDVVMPAMNGRELADKLRALRPGLRCLFMSGHTANVIAHHGVLDEGVAFLEKPFSVQGLAAKVREVLANGR